MEANYSGLDQYQPLERAGNRYFTTPNYLSPTAFRVIIPRLPKITYFIQTVSIPTVSITPMDIPFKGFSRMQAPASLDLSDQIIINFTIDENMENWQEMYDWMTAVVASRENNGAVNTSVSLYSDIVVLVYNNAKKMKKKLTFHECFPQSMTSFEFNSSVNDIDPFMVSCNFSYKTLHIDSY